MSTDWSYLKCIHVNALKKSQKIPIAQEPRPAKRLEIHNPPMLYAARNKQLTPSYIFGTAVAVTQLCKLLSVGGSIIMQASVQTLPLTLAPPSKGGVLGVASSGKSQGVDNVGEALGTDFLESLKDSLQELAQGDASPLLALDQTQLLATVEQYLSGQSQLLGGNGLPPQDLIATAGTSGGDELTADLRELMERLRNLLLNSAMPVAATAAAPDVVAATAVVSDAAAQVMLDQRRLLERFQSLPELRRAGDITPVAEVQPDINASVDLALTQEPQGDEFALQLTKMAELNTLTMSLKEGLALDTKVTSGAVDLASLPAATLLRQPSPLANSADVRPMAPSYIQVPLNDSQWQSDFNNRVTWLARAGGNQRAEIRLNPANLGPIEVRVMMKDDQASITFSAQHGAVRDAIEASLPRLREMFLSSGMQLAQANVSDQPLQEQRQRQQPGAGDGDSQTRQGQPDISDDIASTTSFVESRTSGLVDSLDLYV